MTGEYKIKEVKIRNPWKRYQAVGVLHVRMDDAAEIPPTLPDETPLLTKEEKMERDFEKAGQPKKGAKDD